MNIEVSATANKDCHFQNIGKNVIINLGRTESVIKINACATKIFVTVKVVNIVISYMSAAAGVISAGIYRACIVALV